MTGGHDGAVTQAAEEAAARVDERVREVRAVVTVPTYRRPERLARLLARLREECTGLTARVVVVDNDPAGGARHVVAAFPDVTYVHEPAPGLAHVRNRALDAAAGHDVAVLVDDDEVPGPGWLTTLLGRWLEWGCTAVAGPVRWDLDVDAPWVRASGVLDRVRRPTGMWLRGAATSNLLLDVAATTALGLRFDERFGLSGGEDTMFTHLLVHRGGTIRWCDEAEVVEAVPAERATRRWVLRRTFRTGTTWSRVHVALAGSTGGRVATRLELTARGAYCVAAGSLALVAGTLRPDLRRRARGACDVASGAGVVAGVLGWTYREYARAPAQRAGASSSSAYSG